MTLLTNQPEQVSVTAQPVKKVTVGAFTGALVTLTVLILNNFHPFFEERPIPGEISGAATTVVTFIVSYLVPPGRDEAIAIKDEVTKSAKK